MSTWRNSSTLVKNGKASAKASTRSPASAASARAIRASRSRTGLFRQHVAEHDAEALARVLGRDRGRAVERAQVGLREVDARREDAPVEALGQAARRVGRRLVRRARHLGAAEHDAGDAGQAGARSLALLGDLDAEAARRLAQARRAPQQ